MRWFVDIVPLGSGTAERVCVEASHWQPALKLARELRGDGAELAGLSVEFLDEGCRAIDSATRLRYTVRRAPEDAPLSHKPSVAPPAGPLPGPSVHPTERPPAMPQPESGRRRLRTLEFTSPGTATTPDEPSEPPAAARARTVAFASVGDAVVTQPPHEPADEPADGPADEPADGPADEPADGPADEPADEPAGGEPHDTDVDDGGADSESAVDGAGALPSTDGPDDEAAGVVLPATAAVPAAASEVVPPSVTDTSSAEQFGAAEEYDVGDDESAAATDGESSARPGDRFAEDLSDETMPSAGVEQLYELLSTRSIEPTADSPLTYREYVFGLHEPLPDAQLEQFVRARLADVRQALASADAGRVVNIAVFDHVFHGRPLRPPVITLSWKDWRAEGAEIALYPYGGGPRIHDRAVVAVAPTPLDRRSTPPPTRASQPPADPTGSARSGESSPLGVASAADAAVAVMPVIAVTQSGSVLPPPAPVAEPAPAAEPAIAEPERVAEPAPAAEPAIAIMRVLEVGQSTQAVIRSERPRAIDTVAVTETPRPPAAASSPSRGATSDVSPVRSSAPVVESAAESESGEVPDDEPTAVMDRAAVEAAQAERPVDENAGARSAQRMLARADDFDPAPMAASSAPEVTVTQSEFDSLLPPGMDDDGFGAVDDDAASEPSWASERTASSIDPTESALDHTESALDDEQLSVPSDRPTTPIGDPESAFDRSPAVSSASVSVADDEPESEQPETGRLPRRSRRSVAGKRVDVSELVSEGRPAANATDEQTATFVRGATTPAARGSESEVAPRSKRSKRAKRRAAAEARAQREAALAEAALAEAAAQEQAAAEEARVAEQAAAEEASAAEQAAAEEARVAEQAAAEEARVAEQAAAEESRVAEQAAAEAREVAATEQAAAEEARAAEKAAEAQAAAKAQAVAERARAAERVAEAQAAEQSVAEEAREKEQAAAEKQRAKDRAAAEKPRAKDPAPSTRGSAVARSARRSQPTGEAAPPGAQATASQRGASLPPRPAFSGPRLRGDELLTDLFEVMAELPFIEEALDGADFVLAQVLERLPCELGLLSLFDMAHREYVVVRQIGGARSGVLLRLPQRAKLPRKAMRYGRAMIVADSVGYRDAADERWGKLGVAAKSLLCAPVELDGRFLGLIELVNPQDGKPFAETDGHALTYAGQQLAEFVAARGVVVAPDEVLEGLEAEGG